MELVAEKNYHAALLDCIYGKQHHCYESLYTVTKINLQQNKSPLSIPPSLASSSKGFSHLLADGKLN